MSWICQYVSSAVLIVSIVAIHLFVVEVQSASVLPNTSTTSGITSTIKWSPSRVSLQDVSQSYPDSFWRKLTSSAPRRTFALENVSLDFDPSSSSSSDGRMMTLLSGESSSGKSTILRLVMGSERPISGTVRISSNNNNNNNNDAEGSIARPVCLDTKPSYGQNEVVEDIWNNNKALWSCWGTESSSSSNSNSSSDRPLVDALSRLLKVPLQAKILDLSMSEVYLCRIGEACLQSMLMGRGEEEDRGLVGTTKKEKKSTDDVLLEGTPEESALPTVVVPLFPAPILLLDEWLDTETSVVVQNVQSSLNELAKKGAVVICVTHKPHLFLKGGENGEVPCYSSITLSRGKVLSTSNSNMNNQGKRS
jgi:energy-coupling factor transporter ATP-binding protein EcfA2